MPRAHDPAQVSIGMPVQVVWDDVTPEVSVPFSGYDADAGPSRLLTSLPGH
jgi:uncharacterized OB-fold protein